MRKDKALLLGLVCVMVALLQAPSAKAADIAHSRFIGFIGMANSFVTAVNGDASSSNSRGAIPENAGAERAERPDSSAVAG